MALDTFTRYTKLRKACRIAASVALGRSDPKRLDPAIRDLFDVPFDPATGTSPSGAISRDREVTGSDAWQLLMCAVEEGGLRVGGEFSLDGYLAFLWAFKTYLRGARSNPPLLRYLQYLTSWGGGVWEDRVQLGFGGLQFPLVLQRTCAGLNWKMPLKARPKDIEYAFRVSEQRLDDLVTFVDPRVFTGPIAMFRSRQDSRVPDPESAWRELEVLQLPGLPVVLSGSSSGAELIFELAILSRYAADEKKIGAWVDQLSDPGVAAQVALGACEMFKDVVLRTAAGRSAVELLSTIAMDPSRAVSLETKTDKLAGVLNDEAMSLAAEMFQLQAEGLDHESEEISSIAAVQEVTDGLGKLLTATQESASHSLTYGLPYFTNAYAYSRKANAASVNFRNLKKEGFSILRTHISDALFAYASFRER